MNNEILVFFPPRWRDIQSPLRPWRRPRCPRSCLRLGDVRTAVSVKLFQIQRFSRHTAKQTLKIATRSKNSGILGSYPNL